MKMTRLPNGAGSVKLDVDIPEGMIEAMTAKFVARVGILGSKTARGEAGKLKKGGGHGVTKVAAEQTNAEIGLLHEKGSISRGIPRRSFLEVPLVQHGEGIARDGKIIQKNLKSMLDDKIDPVVAWKQAFKELGIAAERVIQKAFRTRGFGDWAPNSPMTISRKGSDAPLIDTAQLRRSVTSQVIER